MFILNADYGFVDVSDVNSDEVSLRRWPRYRTFLTPRALAWGCGVKSLEHAL